MKRSGMKSGRASTPLKTLPPTLGLEDRRYFLPGQRAQEKI